MTVRREGSSSRSFAAWMVTHTKSAWIYSRPLYTVHIHRELTLSNGRYLTASSTAITRLTFGSSSSARVNPPGPTHNQTASVLIPLPRNPTRISFDEC